MVFKRYSELLAKSVQRILTKLRYKHMGKCHGIQCCEIILHTESFRIYSDEGRIEGSIMRYQHRIFAEIKKSRQYLVNGISILYHTIIYRSQLLDTVGYRNLGINKQNEVTFLCRPEFDDLIKSSNVTSGGDMWT